MPKIRQHVNPLKSEFFTIPDVPRVGRPDGGGFLEVELGPSGKATYRFTPGVAKTSLARGVAERLGVTR